MRQEQEPESSTAVSTTVSSSGSSETTSQAQGSPSGSTGSLSEIQGATGMSVKPKVNEPGHVIFNNVVF